MNEKLESLSVELCGIYLKKNKSWDEIAKFIKRWEIEARIEIHKEYEFVNPPNNSDGEYIKGWRDRNRYVVEQSKHAQNILQQSLKELDQQ